jgi:hypothetical protein
MDDGKPGNHKVLAAWAGNCSNASVNTDFDANYRYSSSSAPTCHIQYRIEN